MIQLLQHHVLSNSPHALQYNGAVDLMHVLFLLENLAMQQLLLTIL